MSIFFPTFYMNSVTDITEDFLTAHGIKGLVLDVDNTLTTHDNPIPQGDIAMWLEEMKSADISLMIVSNNSMERVKPFAELLGLPFVADGKKPLKSGIARAAKEMKLISSEIAVVGDQIFTDIIGGNNFGSITVMVEPLGAETVKFIKFKRVVEKLLLKLDRRRNN